MGKVQVGGNIIGGVGGCIYKDAFGSNLSPGSAVGLDVAQWIIESEYVNAECTHSGTWGAICRRRVAYDFSFFCTVPLDQSNVPENLLYDDCSVAVRFNLGDVTLSNQAIAAGMVQKYYLAPSALVVKAKTILDATGRDVIRQEVYGQGNSVLFLMPDDQEIFQKYWNYIQNKGWAF